MSQYAAELCTLLVEDNFGDLFGRIYGTLVQYGRLALPRLRDHAGVTQKQLLHALAAMVQMHLLYHFTSPEDGITYYEANVDAAYYLIRTPKILEVVEERLGSYAAQVMSAIAYRGHVQIGDLETLPELQVKSQKSHPLNGIYHEDAGEPEHKEENEEEMTANGVDNNTPAHEDLANGEHAPSNNRLHATLKYLAGHGYICRVRNTHFHSLGDNTIEAQRDALTQAGSDPKSKKATELEFKIKELLTERLDGDLSKEWTAFAVPPATKRSQTNGDSAHPAKRRRVESSDVEDNDPWDDDDGEDLDGDEPMEFSIVVRVNYSKLDVVLRNRRFVELAAQATSSATAEVYGTLLRLIEYHTQRCRETAELPREGEEGEAWAKPVTLQRLTNEIDSHLDLSGSIGPNTKPQSLSKNNKHTLTNGMGGTYDEADEDGQSETTRAHDVDQHLRILAQPPYRLTTRQSQGSVPAWTVEFRRLARELRHLEIERIVGMRFGRIALRLIRILLDKGKLDEKRLQEISLISQKDLRQILAQLQENGYVDLQEIPRDAQRMASRSVFLWFYDPDRVGRNLLHDIYKAMSRCLQRLRFERARLKDFLDRMENFERTGAIDRLPPAQLKKYETWQEKEALIMNEVLRLDDMVAVFRDY